MSTYMTVAAGVFWSDTFNAHSRIALVLLLISISYKTCCRDIHIPVYAWYDC